MIGMYIMLGWGFVPDLSCLATPLRAESAGFEMHSEHGDVLGFAMVFLVARAFSSGCAALTGVEAISNGVPAFQKPEVAQRGNDACCCSAVIAVTLFMGIIMLAKATGVKMAERPHEQLIGAPPDYHQKTLIAQLADAVFHDFPLGLYLIARRHRVDPGAGRQHRLQRLPRAGIDSGPGPLPAPSAAHPRRPAGVLQRHPVPGLRGDRTSSSRSRLRSPR